MVVVGDVFYDWPKNILGRIMDKFSNTDVVYIIYKYPEDAGIAGGNKMSRLQYQCHQQQVQDMNAALDSNTTNNNHVRFVEKKISTYHPYHRENVAIWVLKGYPLSGQPKSDVERDVASFQRWVFLHAEAQKDNNDHLPSFLMPVHHHDILFTYYCTNCPTVRKHNTIKRLKTMSF